MEFYREANSGQILQDLYAQHSEHPANYVHFYSLLDTFTPPPDYMSEYGVNANVRVDPGMHSLLNSDYVVSASPITLRFTDSNHIRYTILKNISHKPK